MRFIDQLSGQSVEKPPERTHFGRWLVAPGDGPVHVNGHPASAGDVLAPEAAGDWALVRPGDTIPTRGRFFADAIPDNQDAEALLQLGQTLRDPGKASGGWLEWSDTSPLAPGLDEAVEVHRLEDRIEAEIGHLAAVCRHPRTHIRRETERVLVARARRISRDAPAQLAMHTEDWEHRTIGGIHPRRVLADVREERWDLYENRVVVGLLDDLVTWLRRRIHEVRRIRDDVYARMEQIHGAASGVRRRADRIYTLWGEGWDNGPGEVAESTLKRLEDLLYRLLGLMDSPLYRHIPPRARAPGGLRTTNLFANDDHYRGVARLWHEWSRLAVPRTLSPSELWSRYQNLHRGFDAWCMLLVVRACSQLRLAPEQDEDWESELRPDSTVRLDQGFRLDWEQSGAIALAEAGAGGCRVLLRFVPLVHGLEGARTQDALEARIAPLVEAVADESHWTIVLHPASPGQPPHDALAGVGNPPVPGTRGAIDFIRVSPFSLDSVERVARAIRWATLVPRMLEYPMPLGIGPIPESTLEAYPKLHEPLKRALGNGGWLVDGGGSDGWVVVYPPTDNALSDVATRCLEESRVRRIGLEQERRQLQRDRRYDHQRRDLNQQIKLAEAHEAWLDMLLRESGKAIRSLATLAKCPVCGGADTEFEPRQHGCFLAYCRSKGCGAQWELRHNGASDSNRDAQARVPVLRTGGADDAERSPDNAAPQWVDDILGCDVLAIPFARNGGDRDFLQPRTVPRSP